VNSSEIKKPIASVPTSASFQTEAQQISTQCSLDELLSFSFLASATPLKNPVLVSAWLSVFEQDANDLHEVQLMRCKRIHHTRIKIQALKSLHMLHKCKPSGRSNKGNRPRRRQQGVFNFICQVAPMCIPSNKWFREPTKVCPP